MGVPGALPSSSTDEGTFIRQDAIRQQVTSCDHPEDDGHAVLYELDTAATPTSRMSDCMYGVETKCGK